MNKTEQDWRESNGQECLLLRARGGVERGRAGHPTSFSVIYTHVHRAYAHPYVSITHTHTSIHTLTYILTHIYTLIHIHTTNTCTHTLTYIYALTNTHIYI